MSVSIPSMSAPSLLAGTHHTMSQAALAARRTAFRALHERGCFVIPNPWDAAWTGFMRAAETLQTKGSFAGLANLVPYAEINGLLATDLPGHPVHGR